MEVYPVVPFGYCAGVQGALKLAETAVKENPNRAVYLLGMLVHNEDAVASLKALGLKLLDEKDAPLEIQLQRIPEGQVVLFSAHGHDHHFDEIALKKHLKIYDATCPFVTMNLKEALSHPSVIYIGVAGHLESLAFLANDPTAIFYDVKTASYGQSKVSGDTPYVISQTTLSESELQKAHQQILKDFPKASIGSERCHSTTLRQEALKHLPSDIDVVIVLGSTRSNNSLKLAEIATASGHDTHLVLDLSALKALDLQGKKKAALCSGASTSSECFNACLAYLKSL
jgi:4-hydroxy-3-methylbut-2-enyl diphosphate reductase